MRTFKMPSVTNLAARRREPKYSATQEVMDSVGRRLNPPSVDHSFP